MFCPMAANIEQVLQALGQMTEMLRLMAVNQEAQAQQAQHAAQQAQQAQPGNRRGDERRGVGLDERYFRRVEKLESHNNWKDFSFQFATAVGAADPQVKKMLDFVTRASRNPNWDDIFELYSDRGDLDGLEPDLRGAVPFGGRRGNDDRPWGASWRRLVGSEQDC